MSNPHSKSALQLLAGGLFFLVLISFVECLVAAQIVVKDQITREIIADLRRLPDERIRLDYGVDRELVGKDIDYLGLADEAMAGAGGQMSWVRMGHFYTTLAIGIVGAGLPLIISLYLYSAMKKHLGAPDPGVDQ